MSSFPSKILVQEDSSHQIQHSQKHGGIQGIMGSSVLREDGIPLGYTAMDLVLGHARSSACFRGKLMARVWGFYKTSQGDVQEKMGNAFKFQESCLTGDIILETKAYG